jgi:hypothetical protein
VALVATFVSAEEGGAPTARLRHHETENGGGDTHVSECLKSTIPIFWRSVQNCTVVRKSLKRVVGNHDLRRCTVAGKTCKSEGFTAKSDTPTKVTPGLLTTIPLAV